MRESMEIYPRTAVERTMKLHEVLLRASAGKIRWWPAAEWMGISSRQLRRWRKRRGPPGFAGSSARDTESAACTEGEVLVHRPNTISGHLPKSQTLPASLTSQQALGSRFPDHRRLGFLRLHFLNSGMVQD